MIGQMAITIALLGLNDLGLTFDVPTFLFRNIFYLQLSTYVWIYESEAKGLISLTKRASSKGDDIKI